MKLSTILATLSAARLPSVTGEQLQHLVGTAEGKAFADDLKWFAAGEVGRRAHLSAVVHALAPGVRRTVERLGFQFDLRAIISAAKLDGSEGLNIIKAASADPGNRARAVAYLQGAGLQLATNAAASAPAQAGPIAPPYYSFKIFGSTAALCVSEARTRAGNRCTIQVEGALGLGADGRREFDWQNKIIVQLTVQEAYLALALFENKLKSIRFDGHGNRHDKSLHIEFQERHYFVRMTQRGKAAVAVPVSPVDALQIVSLIYKQIGTNDPHLEIAQIRAFTDRLAQMTNTAAN
jgi:hypothetical protein